MLEYELDTTRHATHMLCSVQPSGIWALNTVCDIFVNKYTTNDDLRKAFAYTYNTRSLYASKTLNVTQNVKPS